MLLLLLTFIVCYAITWGASTGSYDEFSSPHPSITTRGKLLGISLIGFVLAIPFSFALNAIALYVNHRKMKACRFLQASIVIALVGFIAVPVILFFDKNTSINIIYAVAAVPIVMWLVSCYYLFRLSLYPESS